MRIGICLAALAIVGTVFADVVLENAAFRLTVGDWSKEGLVRRAKLG